MIKDVELSNILDIPISTLKNWKKSRIVLYKFLKSHTKESLIKRLKTLDSLDYLK